MSNCLSSKPAFEALFKEHYRSLVSYAWKMTKNQELAEDMVQQVFVTLWEKRESIEIDSNPKSYLLRSTHNACLNHFKHEKVKDQHAEYVMLNASDRDQQNQLEQEEFRLKVQASVQKLPTECRRVFLMSRLQGKKYAQIAEELNISVKTVENQMGKALKILRIELKGEIKETFDVLQTIFWMFIGVKYLSVVIR